MACQFQIGTSHGSSFWINLECCGLVCGVITWLLIGYGMYAFTFCVVYPWLGDTLHGYFHILLFNLFSLTAIYSHIRAMSTDPGAVPKEALPLLEDLQEYPDVESNINNNAKFRKYCKRCQSFKPIRAHHCSICGRCIVKMDHHCPWVNNCIGIGNHKLFILFIFWVNVISVYAVILVIARCVACVASHADSYSSYSKECGTPNETLSTIFLLVESILFGLFTFCMMSDQASAIADNQTQIDRLKNEKHEVKSAVNEVFGTPSEVSCSWWWIIPVPVEFPESVRDVVRGYRLSSDMTYSEMTPLTSTTSEEIEREREREREREMGNMLNLIHIHTLYKKIMRRKYLKSHGNPLSLSLIHTPLLFLLV